jgi:hypothetical protein
MDTNKEEILQLEKSFWEHANDPDFFREKFADDGLAIMEPTGYIDKNQAIEMSSKGKAFKNVKMEDVQVRELTPDCIAVAYHGEGTPEGTDEPYRGSICSVYVRRDGRWQLAVSDHHRRESEHQHAKR